MYLKILVPVDGSELAECVLPAAAGLASGSSDSHVTFLYAVQPLEAPMVDARYRKKIETEALAAARTYLRRLTGRPEFKGRSSAKALVSMPADAISDYAAANKVDLIIMATHGRSGIGQWFYGSVAEKVVHGSKVPVWLVKPGLCGISLRPRGLSIVAPLDGSPLAECVFPHLQSLSVQLSCNRPDISLVRVCEVFSPPFTYPPSTSMSWDEYLKYETARCKEICRAYLAGVREKLQKRKLKTSTVVLEGNPAEELILYVKKHGVDLVVMSTHGRTGISKWAFGSIAEKVLKGANCPVLMIRAK